MLRGLDLEGDMPSASARSLLLDVDALDLPPASGLWRGGDIGAARNLINGGCPRSS